MQAYIKSLISDLNDKNIEKILINLAEYVDEKVKQYQKELILDTIVDPQTPVIYTQVVKKDKIDLISDSFVPIVNIVHNDNWIENFNSLYIPDEAEAPTLTT